MIGCFDFSQKPEDSNEIKVILKQKKTSFIDFSKLKRKKLRQIIEITPMLSNQEKVSNRKSVTSYFDSEYIHEEK
jgi:hypothetical protein